MQQNLVEDNRKEDEANEKLANLTQKLLVLQPLESELEDVKTEYDKLLEINAALETLSKENVHELSSQRNVFEENQRKYKLDIEAKDTVIRELNDSLASLNIEFKLNEKEKNVEIKELKEKNDAIIRSLDLTKEFQLF